MQFQPKTASVFMENGEKRFVLIDDDELTNQIHESIIGVWAQKNVPVEVFVFHEASKAIDWLCAFHAEYKPDLIFLDLNMPVMNGWDFLDKYRKLGLLTPICVLSSSIQKSDKERALAHPNVTNYISKPLKPVDLDALSERVL